MSINLTFLNKGNRCYEAVCGHYTLTISPSGHHCKSAFGHLRFRATLFEGNFQINTICLPTFEIAKRWLQREHARYARPTKTEPDVITFDLADFPGPGVAQKLERRARSRCLQQGLELITSTIFTCRAKGAPCLVNRVIARRLPPCAP